MNAMNPLTLLAAPLRWLARLSARSVLLLATAVFAAGVMMAINIADRPTALFLTTVFSLVAGFIYALTIPQALARGTQDKTRELEAREAALRDALAAQRNLDAEIARLRSMKISVESYKPILRLNLISVKAAIRDYLHTPAATDTVERSGGMLGLGQKERRTSAELFNVVRVAFEANLGVDLQALRFRRVSDGEVEVTGFARDFQGFQSMRTEKELSARLERITRVDSGKVEQERFLTDDAEALKKSDLMQSQIIQRVNEGLEFAHLDEGIRRMTEAFLKVIFSPLGLTLHFVADAPPQGLGLVEFMDEQNRQFDARIAVLEGQARQRLGP